MRLDAHSRPLMVEIINDESMYVFGPPDGPGILTPMRMVRGQFGVSMRELIGIARRPYLQTNDHPGEAY